MFPDRRIACNLHPCKKTSMNARQGCWSASHTNLTSRTQSKMEFFIRSAAFCAITDKAPCRRTGAFTIILACFFKSRPRRQCVNSYRQACSKNHPAAWRFRPAEVGSTISKKLPARGWVVDWDVFMTDTEGFSTTFFEEFPSRPSAAAAEPRRDNHLKRDSFRLDVATR